MTTALRNLGWGLYGASAWTWCIGMYLPVLMIQWYGWWGFLVVAIPNVVGCTFMGLRLRTAEASRRFCAAHATAMRWFAIATVGFQLLFLAIVAKWFLPHGHELVSNLFVIPLLAFSLAWLLAMLPRTVWPWFGAAAFVVSVVVLTLNLSASVPLPDWLGTKPGMDTVWLIPIFAFGFLLCPWLDAPFHRVLRETNDRRTFWVVGGAFFVLLALTASYWTLRPGLLVVAVFVHLLVQTIFTMAANLRELSPVGLVGGRAGIALLLPLFAPVLPWIGTRLTVNPWTGTLDTYLRYLALYGVVFPAIVLFYATPRRCPRTLARNTIVIISILIAASCADVGLIDGPAFMATIAVAVLLITRYALADRTELLSSTMQTGAT